MTDNMTRQETNKKEENFFVELVKTLITAGILAFGIRTFVAEARYIPSSSMEPTLQINDRLIIEKIGYSCILDRCIGEPKRGDIVVFSPTDALKQQNYKDAFIKRIIGLPGDKVEVKERTVYVNDKPLTEPYIKDKPGYNYPATIIPPNNYLVFGDNRNNSYDSHYWGFVPRENIIGRATIRFWPFDRLGGIPPEPNYK